MWSGTGRAYPAPTKLVGRTRVGFGGGLGLAWVRNVGGTARGAAGGGDRADGKTRRVGSFSFFCALHRAWSGPPGWSQRAPSTRAIKYSRVVRTSGPTRWHHLKRRSAAATHSSHDSSANRRSLRKTSAALFSRCLTTSGACPRGTAAAVGRSRCDEVGEAVGRRCGRDVLSSCRSWDRDCCNVGT